MIRDTHKLNPKFSPHSVLTYLFHPGVTIYHGGDYSVCPRLSIEGVSP